MQKKCPPISRVFLLYLIMLFSVPCIAEEQPADPFSMNQKNHVQQISSAYLKGPGFSGMVPVSVINGIKEGLFEGDILVPPQTKGNIAPESNDNRWPNNTLYYKLVNTSTATNRRVHLATQYIADKTHVKFVKLNSNDESKHHVKVYDSYPNISSLCASSVGRTNLRAGYQNLYLIGGCSLESTIHEFLHALGMWHEQSRTDRDRYVTIHWNRIHAQSRYNFEIQTNSQSVGPYDFKSIMHYPFWAFNINNDARTVTIQSKVPGQPVTYWNDEMSHGDIQSINHMYPKITEPIATNRNMAQLMAPIIAMLLEDE